MKKKIRIILAVIACIIVALVGYSAYEVHQSAQEFQKAYESKKSFERTETDEAEADGEKKAEEQSGDRPYGVLEPGSEYEVDTYIDNRDNSNRLYIYDMDYVDLALDFKPKKLADFIDVINENSKIARKFKPMFRNYLKISAIQLMLSISMIMMELQTITGRLEMVSGIIKSFLMHIRNVVKDLDLLLNIWMFQQKKLKRVQSGLDRWQSNFDERRKRWILSLVSYLI